MTDLDKLLTIKTNNIIPSKGKLLISEPFLRDYYFKRSVVLLADHNDEGSFGIIVNKPIDVKFSEIVKDFPNFNSQLYLGGPVNTNSLFFIHTIGNKIENSSKIMDGLYWGGDIETAKEMIALNQILPDEIRFFIGYSGWSPKQLENELKINSWVVTRAKHNLIFKSDHSTLWNKLVQSLGENYSLWENFPTDPALN